MTGAIMIMLRRTILLFCLLTMGVVGGKAEINFTPAVKQYSSEGAEYSSVTFKEDKRIISMEVPRLWTCRGDASRLQFAPPNQNFAEGIVQAVSTNGLLSFNEVTVKALEAQVTSGLPLGSQAIALLTQQENPVILEQNLSYEFVVSYQTLGKTFQRSVIFVNCPNKQLVFRFSAPKESFDALNKTFRRSICSWQSIEPSPTAKKEPAVAIAPVQPAPSTN
jgi:hypothetical protein